jgi:Domain of unknown function (DUF4432)
MPCLFGRHYTREDLLRRVGHINQIGGVQLYELSDGLARGVRGLEFRTGTGFCFKVLLDRGMDVGPCEYNGASLAWIPPSLFPGPWFFEQQTEFGWLRSALGGFCNTCGLVHIGNPEIDTVEHYNFPARSQERYGVHDRVAMLPAQLIRYGERWEGDDCILEAEGRIVQVQAYGEHLVLTRRYTARLGESRYYLHDEVTNAGYLPAVHMLLYHINVGFPFLGETSELLAPTRNSEFLSVGKNPDNKEDYKWFLAPQKNWMLEGYELMMLPDEDGRVRVALVNPRLPPDGQAVYVIYHKGQLPTYLEWRMMAESTYAVGIEPCTNTFGRKKVRERGEMIILQPGDTRHYDLEIGVLTGQEEIAEFSDKMTATMAIP